MSTEDPAAGGIWHLAMPEDWAEARRTGTYDRARRGASVAEEGFVHCSFAHQVPGTAEAYYDDVDELVVLRIDPDRCEGELRVEDGTGTRPGDFPHLHGTIPVVAVVDATTWRRDPVDGWSRPPW